MTTPSQSSVRDSVNDVLLGALREHMVNEVPESLPGSGPLEYHQRHERARLQWEQQRDAYHAILAARLLRAYLEANGVNP